MPKFKQPDGFEVPADAEDGEFSVVAKIKDNGDGTLTLIEIDGSRIAGYEDEDEEEEVEEVEETRMGPDAMFGRMKEAGFGKRIGR